MPDNPSKKERMINGLRMMLCLLKDLRPVLGDRGGFEVECREELEKLKKKGVYKYKDNQHE